MIVDRLRAEGRLETYPDRAAWLADAGRQAPEYRLGATACASILRRGWSSPWDVWCEAREAPEPRPDDGTLSRGREMEPVILAEYQRTRDTERVATFAALHRVVHAEHSWLAPSPDALVALDDDDDGGWEGKTDAYGDGWGEDGRLIQRWDESAVDLVPAGYAIQVYVLLAATGLPWWDVTVAIPMRGKFLDYRTIRLERDATTQEEIVETVRAWRERHLVGGEWPPIDATQGCGRGLARRFAGSSKTKRPASSSEAALVAEYATLGREAKAIEERRDLLSHQLQEAIGADYGGLVLPAVDGKPPTAIVVRSAGRRSVALSAIEKRRPDLAEALAAADLIHTGAASAHIRTYGC